MNKQTQAISDELSTLAEDARAFMTATADVTGETVGTARKRLSSALDRSKEMYDHARDSVINGAKATDEAVRERPYHAMAIAVGVGTVLGLLLARRGFGRRD